MARYTGSGLPLCRRECQALPQGHSLLHKKCSFERRPTPPGQHGVRRRKMGEYGIQLREKQKVRRVYGVLERQFRSTTVKPRGHRRDRRGAPAALETRLDNVVFRLGFAASRPMARQLVNHGHFAVNGVPTDVASYPLSRATVSRSASRRSREAFKVIKETLRSHQAPDWLSLDAAKLGGSLVSIPRRDQMPLDLSEQLVVEYYSR